MKAELIRAALDAHKKDPNYKTPQQHLQEKMALSARQMEIVRKVLEPKPRPRHSKYGTSDFENEYEMLSWFYWIGDCIPTRIEQMIEDARSMHTEEDETFFTLRYG